MHVIAFEGAVSHCVFSGIYNHTVVCFHPMHIGQHPFPALSWQHRLLFCNSCFALYFYVWFAESESFLGGILKFTFYNWMDCPNLPVIYTFQNGSTGAGMSGGLACIPSCNLYILSRNWWLGKKSICFLLREVSALKELDGISDTHLLEGFFDILLGTDFMLETLASWE